MKTLLIAGMLALLAGCSGMGMSTGGGSTHYFSAPVGEGQPTPGTGY